MKSFWKTIKQMHIKPIVVINLECVITSYSKMKKLEMYLIRLFNIQDKLIHGIDIVVGKLLNI